MNYAKAKQLAQKMFGPTARLERGKTEKGTCTWAILIQKNGEWVVAGNGGTFDQMLQNAVQRVTEAKKRIAAQPAVTVKRNKATPVEILTEAKTFSAKEFGKMRVRAHALGCNGAPCSCGIDAVEP